MGTTERLADFALKQVVKFREDERGVATIFACFMIMMMVLVGGIGVDLMRNEMERVRLQNTLDRAVLAAADLDQTLTPHEVVADYFAKSGFPGQPGTVTVDEGLNYRIVTASASTDHETQFMHLMGVDELSIPAAGTAEERISKVEVSLVVDISGSMGSNSRINNLRDASHEFVEQLIREETEDLISISLIPYSEHVNAGPELFNALPNKIHRHDYSHCVEFPSTDFDTTKLSSTHYYDQMQHFQWYYSSWNAVDNTTCPRRDYEEIQAFSQNEADLDNQISQLQPRAQTSIFLGMKWAAALLDPDSQNVITNMVNAGHVDSVFNGRPAAYDDPETLKTIVVMTDGVNTSSYRIEGWAYDSNSDYVHWYNNNLWYYLYRYVRSNQRHQFYDLKYDGGMGDTFLADICTAAKDQGIVVWGVGFEVNDHGADVLEDCASSPSHFFRVEGVEISEAFAAIASQINQLRLTQ
ncbi:MAG: TadE/TadG family type IV pilus assembly protein [Pseudomonadota bacterium]